MPDPQQPQVPTAKTHPGSKAPLLWPLLFWCLGIVLGRDLEAGSLIWLLLALPLAVTAIFKPGIRLWLLLGICLLGGLIRVSYRSPQENILLQTLKQRDHITQDARFEVSKSLADHVWELRLIRLAGSSFDLRLLLYHEDSLRVGGRYSAVIEVLPLTRDPVLELYPSRYPARAFIRGELKALGEASPVIPLASIRDWLRARIEAHAGDAAPIAKALLLSDREAKQLYREPLTEGGMVHLIVVSGLHVWFIYGMLMLVLRSFLPRRGAELAFVLLIWGFAALNYWAAPITRAVLMILVGIAARWMGRRVSSLQTLALSLFVITLAAPGQLFDLGLQLSFLSVGVILLAVPGMRLWPRFYKPVALVKIITERALSYLLISLMVSLAILPLTLYKLGTGSLNGIIGNLLGIPIMAALLPLSVLMLIFVPSGLVGTSFQTAYLFGVWLFERWMQFCAALPFNLSNLWIDLAQALGLAALLLPFYMWARRLRRPVWKLYIPLWSLGLVLLLLPFIAPARGGVWIFNCGTADCALILTPQGHSILVDSGPGNASWEAEREPSKALDTKSWAARRLLPWLKRKGIRHLDELIITHTHADHSGGVPALITSMPVKRLILTDETRDSRLWKLWQSQAWFGNTSIKVITDTLSLDLKGARIKFLHPDREWRTAIENDRSIVFRLDVKARSFLFTGDIEAPSEAWLLARYPDLIDTDYLKVPHHGSKSSNTSSFLRQVSPREAWISTAKRNRFGFPHPEALINLRRYGSRIRQTSDGSIHLAL